jgi:hypothetical protein
MAHESAECLAEGNVGDSEWHQRATQVPFYGNTSWLDESRHHKSTSTKCDARDGEPRC